MSDYLRVILTLCLLLFSACGSQAKEELYEKGLEQLKKGNFNGATVLFKNAIEKDPNYFEARFQLAKAYMASGKTDSAERELKKVITQNRSFRDARLEMARVYLKQNKVDDALKELSAILEETPEDADALVIMGSVYSYKREYGTAEHYLERAFAADKENVNANISMAQLLNMTKRTGEAKSHILEALKSEPTNRTALHMLASLELSGGETESALSTYGLITQHYPSDIAALLRKGLLLVEMGEIEDALSLAEQINRDFPERPEGNRLKGLGLYYSGKYDEAIIALQKAAAIQSQPGVYFYLGLSHYQRGEFEQALTQFHKVLDIFPSFVRAREFAALVLLKQKRFDDSIEEAKRALKINANTGLAHNILGSAYIAKGMIEEGMEELNTAVEINPDLAALHFKKGLIGLKVGRENEGLSELHAAIELDPDLLNARITLASYYVRKLEYEKALLLLEEGISGEKHDAIIHNIIATVLFKQGKAEQGIAQLKKAKKSDPANYAAYHNLASINFVRGDREAGLEILQEILDRSPDNFKALITAARIYELEGKEGEALEFYKKAAETEWQEGDVALAEYYIRQKDFSKAIQVVNSAISKESRPDVRLYQIKGTALASLGRQDESLDAFEEMEEEYPTRGLPFIIGTYVTMNEPERGLKRIQNELKRDPKKIGLKAEVSRLYSIMGRKEKAMENARHIIEQHPDSRVGYLALAQIFQEDGDAVEAVKVLRRAESLDDTVIFMKLGFLMAMQKDYDGATEAFRKAEKSAPGYVPAIYQQGSVHHVRGDSKQAIEKYEKVISLSSRHAGALNNLAYLYAQDDQNLDNAIQLAARAYMAKPNDGSILDTLGFVMMKSGKKKESLEILEKAAGLVPDNPSVHYHLALAYRENSQISSAIGSLEEAIRLGGFPEAESARNLLEELRK